MCGSTASCGSFNLFFLVFIHISVRYDDCDEHYYFRADELDGIYEGVRGGLFLLACSRSSRLSSFKKKKANPNLFIRLFVALHPYVVSEEKSE